ncbi:helix-turn-helix domain-containing protein [Hymenobacter volaticus]|uniref:helix-turn-helix domain-containing protein n=1 Tax=Hymenobacter volaticus TaxID=2932254 RepID=UPI002880ACED|nr:AraC family transcriptional regulator [Hymenobacter volaticus]
MKQINLNRNADIVKTCTEDHHFRAEMLLAENVLVRILSGELKVVLADRIYTFGLGDTLLVPRNQLATLIAYPKDGLSYKAVIMRLTTAILREYYTKNKLSLPPPPASGILPFAKSPLLDSFFASLLPYLELENKLQEKLVAVKTEEAIEILRSLDPQSDSVLADFSEVGKIDLAEFMETNYMFNIPLAKFSQLTGRSLTTFKRDFKKAFQLSPQRWLTQKRLALAHHHLVEKQRKPVELYQEAGFENLSHFSYAFKKQFGYPPTALTGQVASH